MTSDGGHEASAFITGQRWLLRQTGTVMPRPAALLKYPGLEDPELGHPRKADEEPP